MIEQYQQIYAAPTNRDYRLLTEVTKNNVLAKYLHELYAIRKRLEKSLQQTETTLQERTSWGQNLTKELSHAEKNIALERKESKYLKQVISDESKRLTAEITKIRDILKNETSRMEKEINQLNHDYESLNNQFETTQKQLQDTTNNLNLMQHDKDRVEQELSTVYQSRSWRVTKPMRRFTTWARHKRNAVKFRLAQLRGYPSRAIRSLKTRGLMGTLGVIKNKLNKSPVQDVAEIVLEKDFTALKLVRTPSRAYPLLSLYIII